MNLRTILAWSVSMALALGPAARGQDPGAGPGAESGWMASFEESQLCQLGGGQPLAVFVYREPDNETERFFSNLDRWTGAKELLSAFCRVALRVEDHREILRKLGVQSAPCLLVLGSDLSIAPGDRVQGILTELGESQAVLGFLQEAQYETVEGLLLELQSEEAAPPDLQSATDYYQAALDSDDEGDPYRALAYLQEAIERIASPTSELRREALLKEADLAYGLGRLEEALAAYRKSFEVWDASREENETLYRVLYRIVLLPNDVGQNEEAMTYYEPLSKVTSEEKREHIDQVKDLILGGYFVLADMGYPEVGTLSVEAPSSLGVGEEEDRGDPDLSLEERLAKVSRDFAEIERKLKVWFEAKKEYPNFLEEMSGMDPESPDYPTDPFSHSFPYHYLHFENPEEYLLYSIGPDGQDQWGEVEYDPEEGKEGAGDIVVRSP